MNFKLSDNEKSDIDIFVMSNFSILVINSNGTCTLVKTQNFIILIFSSKCPDNFGEVLKYLNERIQDSEVEILSFINPLIQQAFKAYLAMDGTFGECRIICRDEVVDRIDVDGCVGISKFYQDSEIKEHDTVGNMFSFASYTWDFHAGDSSISIYHLLKYSENENLDCLVFIMQISKTTYVIPTGAMPMYYISDIIQSSEKMDRLEYVQVISPDLEDLDVFCNENSVKKLVICEKQRDGKKLRNKELKAGKILTFIEPQNISKLVRDVSKNSVYLFCRKYDLKNMLSGLMDSVKVMKIDDKDIFSFGNNSDEDSNSDESSSDEDSEESEGETETESEGETETESEGETETESSSEEKDK